MKPVLIAILVGVAVCMAVYMATNSMATNSSEHPTFRVTIVPDCSYALPKQYFLVRSESTGKYAVRFMHIDTYPHYLGYEEYTKIPPRYFNMGYANEAATFDDSCSAKGFAKVCIKEIKSGTDEDYKNVQ